MKMDWIQGEKFWQIADFIYTPKEVRKDDYYRLRNTFDVKKLYDGCVIYTHTTYVRELFTILKHLSVIVTVITHNSDANIDVSYDIPENVIKWYTQNVDTLNPTVESIPIGLENNRWFPKIRKKEKMLALMNSSENPTLKNLLYVNHNINTNPDKRSIVYELLKGKDGVTIEEGKNGIDFDRYLINIFTHRFVACPEGNGIDTHRVWECLYLGTIPIVVRNYNTQFYQDLPICFIDNWEEITKEFLKNEWNRIWNEPWNLEKLTFAYWENKIQKKFIRGWDINTKYLNNIS
jgi:hypothetical protein